MAPLPQQVMDQERLRRTSAAFMPPTPDAYPTAPSNPAPATGPARPAIKPPPAYKPPAAQAPAAPVPVQSPADTQRALVGQQRLQMTSQAFMPPVPAQAPAAPVAKPPSAYKPPTVAPVMAYSQAGGAGAGAAGAANPNLAAMQGWGPGTDPTGSAAATTATTSTPAVNSTPSVTDTMRDYAPSRDEEIFRIVQENLMREYGSPDAMARTREAAQSQSRMNMSNALARNPNMSGTERENLGVQLQGNAIASGETARNSAYLSGQEALADWALRGDEQFLSEWERKMAEAALNEADAGDEDPATVSNASSSSPSSSSSVPPIQTTPAATATANPAARPAAQASRTVSGPMPQRPPGGGVASQDAQGNYVWTYPDGWWSNGQWIAKPAAQSQAAAAPPVTTAPAPTITAPANQQNPWDPYTPPTGGPARTTWGVR